MPTESFRPPLSPSEGEGFTSTLRGNGAKCPVCGHGEAQQTQTQAQSQCDSSIFPSQIQLDEREWACAECVGAVQVPDTITSEDMVRTTLMSPADMGLRLPESASAELESRISTSIGLGLQGVTIREESVGSEGSSDEADVRSPSDDIQQEVSSPIQSPSRTSVEAHNIPTSTASTPATIANPSRLSPPSPASHSISTNSEASSSRPTGLRNHAFLSEYEGLPNPLLEACRNRMPNCGRGALHAGAIFRGTQTSGRSAYEVEVKLMDVNFPESSVSGYLSISHLTDAHPHLTTFFTGEIIGPQYGFITGARFGATEHDDMRHWGRFEQFRRPATRGDMVRPELLFRDPLPDFSRGDKEGKERDFVFLRIKERFLVPDHKVKDISGASFAGFYYAMIDLSPPLRPSTSISDTPLSPSHSPLSLRLPTPPPPLGRRRSSDTAAQRRSMPQTEYRNVQSKLARAHSGRDEVTSEATLRGYYFHSLNQEPFQELFLSHVPSKTDAAFEMR